MLDALKRTNRLRTGCGITLTIYWIAMFVGTHLPPSQVSIPGGSDKAIHAMAFFGLGVLLSSWLWLRCKLTIVIATRTWLIILSYAFIDELLQGPVGRTPDFADGIADMTGASLGIAFVHVVAPRLEKHIERRAKQVQTSGGRA